MSKLFSYDEEPDFSGEKFLIIDEDFLLADLIHYHFSKKGYAIDVCKSMNDLADIDLTEYSLIIVDMNYDFDRSLRFITSVRENQFTEDTPLIVCSKTDSNKNIVAALNAGADDYITRPFAISELLIRINKIVGIKN
ncbi:MAG: response regulator [Muribaculaceae bacterium]|nr:response regulator [Muribaculaceae bacterium]